MRPEDQIGDYLLGELDAEARDEFEMCLAHDAALREEVERLGGVVGHLETLDADAWAPPAPPRFREPEGDGRRRRALVVRPVLAAAVAFVILAIGVGAGLLLASGPESGSVSRRLGLAPVEPLGARASGRVELGVAGGRAVVSVRGLPPSRGGAFYELWLLNSADDLVSLGSFRVPASGRATVEVPLPTAPARFKAFDISIEPPDGNPDHSTRSVLRAPLS